MNSSPAPSRNIISVIGPHSGSGKTLLVAHLVRHIGGLACLKVSPAYEQPTGRPTARGTAPSDGAPPPTQGTEAFYLESPERLRMPDKDTALYLDAGAAHVERLRHRAGGLAPGLTAALCRFGPNMPVVVESSAAVALLQPKAVILVVRPPIREMKPGTEAVLQRVTDLFVNGARLPAGTADPETTELRRRFPSLQPEFTWHADLGLQGPPAGLIDRLRSLLAAD